MGKCPHCGSKNIRRRYREHRRDKWRCRNCNRVFRAPKRGVVVWLGVAVVVVVVAAFFAVEQGIITLPPALSPIEESVDRVAEVAVPAATPVAPIATLTTTLHSVSTRVADNAPKVQATIDANARPTTKTVSTAISATSTPISTATPTPRPSATPTVAHTPTPIPPPHLRHIDEKQYMLELINIERKKADVPPVELGDNTAAQLHAEAALENCFSSHWGIDGLTPYMRYSLAGGYQSNGENGSGLDYCNTEKDRVAPLKPMRQEMADSIKGFMGSPGHRDNILYEHHKKVNIGIAKDRYNLFIYQHFEGDHIEYEVMPNISDDGILTLVGTTKNGVVPVRKRDLGVTVYYHRPPHDLTRGQVSRTYCYGYGLHIASLREPLTDGSSWTTDTFTYTYEPCPDPYDVSMDAPAPHSSEQAHAFWEEAYEASENRKQSEVTSPWITALNWNVDATSFDVRADLSRVLNRHGKGIYTIAVWANLGDEQEVVSQYSIFYGITPPDTYTPR